MLMMAGTIDNPATFKKVITSSGVIPGDEIRIIEDQNDDFVSTVVGNEVSVVKVCSYNNQKKIDGNITISGGNTKWENIEFMTSAWTKRITNIPTSYPSDMPCYQHPNIIGSNTELYRCIIHDTAGVGLWKSAPNSIIRECVIFFNGWVGPDRVHGHGIYTQNTSGKMTIERSIIFFPYMLGVKIGGTGAYSGYLFKDCIFFGTCDVEANGGAALLTAGVGQFSNIEINTCEFYDRRSTNKPALIYFNNSDGYDNVKLINNYSVGCQAVYFHPLAVFTNSAVSGNIFYSDLSNPGGAWEQFKEGNTWGGRPISGSRIRLIICEAGVRGHLVIYNYNLDNTVAADCSTLLSEGDSYRLTNVQDYFVDVITGTAGVGGVITVPMTGRTVASPIASAVTLISTFPEFGCFIIEKIV